MSRFSLQHLRGDLFGGITTTVVSLPMALAFGVASGAGAQAGLYGAILVGLFAALFGGSRTLISEPTGPMTVVMTAVVTTLIAANPEHGLTLAFTVVMLAGAFQILLGALKLGRYITLMPYSVISGFMSGIGLLLIILQVAPMLGYPTPPGGVHGLIAALPGMIEDMRFGEIALGAFSLVGLFFMPDSWRKKVPPALSILIAGTLLSFALPGTDELRRIGAVPMGLPSLHFPMLTYDLLAKILVDAMILGVLGAIDTTLTAMIADSLTRSQHDTNRELIGQGVGNMLSGLFGGLPGAGATMGTVVSIEAGARTPIAAVIRSLLLLVVVLFAAPLTQHIPMAVLAGIAVKVGVNILDWSFLKRAHRVSLSATLIMYGVMFLTVFVDLIVAVGVGVFIANILTIERLSKVQSRQIKTIAMADDHVVMSDEEKRLFALARERVVLFYLSGPMIFGVAKAIAREHAALQDSEVLILDLADVPLLGTTVCLSLENVIEDALADRRKVLVVTTSDEVQARLARLEVVQDEPAIQFMGSRLEALQTALQLIEPTPNEEQTS